MVHTLHPTQTESLTSTAPVTLFQGNGLDRARMQTPGFIALRTGIRHETPFIMKRKDP